MLDTSEVAKRPFGSFSSRWFRPERHGLKTQIHALRWMTDLGLRVNPDNSSAQDTAALRRVCERWETKRERLPYGTRRARDQGELLSRSGGPGIHVQSPRWGIAYKFGVHEAETKLTPDRAPGGPHRRGHAGRDPRTGDAPRHRVVSRANAPQSGRDRAEGFPRRGSRRDREGGRGDSPRCCASCRLGTARAQVRDAPEVPCMRDHARARSRRGGHAVREPALSRPGEGAGSSTSRAAAPWISKGLAGRPSTGSWMPGW